MYSRSDVRLVISVLSALCVALTVAQRPAPECIKYEVHEFFHTNPSQERALTDNCLAIGGFLDTVSRARFSDPGPIKFNVTFECCANQTCNNDLDCPFNFLCNTAKNRCVVANCELADEVDLIANEGQECDIDDDCAFSVPGDANNWKCIAAPCPGGNCISRDKCKRCSKASHSRLLPPEPELTTTPTTHAPPITTEKPTTATSNLLLTTVTPSPFSPRVAEVSSTIADDLNNSIPDTMATTTTSADGAIHTTVSSTVDDIEDITITNAPIDLFNNNNVTSIVTDDSNITDNVTESTSVTELATDAPTDTTTTSSRISTDVPDVIVNSGTLLIPLIRPNTAAANGN